MSEVSAIPLDPSEFPEWNDYVMKNPQGTVFHTTDWLQIFSSQVEVVVVRNEKKVIVAGVALAKSTRFGVSGYHGVSFTPLMGPLFTKSIKPRTSSALAEDFSLVQTLLIGLPKAALFDFSMSSENVLMPYIWNGFDTSVRYHYILQDSYESYSASLVQKKRRDIKLAYEAVDKGEYQISDLENRNELAQLIAGERDQTGMKVAPEILRGIAEFDAARTRSKAISIRDAEGNLLAGMLMVFTEKMVHAVISAVSSNVRNAHNYANLLAYDASIKWALESGRSFNFCGSVTPGIERFLRMMGGDIVPVYRVQKTSSPLFFALQTGKRFLSERKPFRIVE